MKPKKSPKKSQKSPEVDLSKVYDNKSFFKKNNPMTQHVTYFPYFTTRKTPGGKRSRKKIRKNKK